ncbi:hypothetical protein QQZ08_010318 [Neonectria magnoliae]|uniref:Uncharacterized protein n=1 Tax=Neonectria magnoliae TaxID=2732573 RepID=A0ABR1HHR2_9HYPO
MPRRQRSRFCKTDGFGDPDRRLESITVSILKSFFTWWLHLKAGKGGRGIKGIKKSSSLGMKWKVFRLVYERVVGMKLDLILNRQMHKVLKELVKDHGLSSSTRENRRMTINNLKEQNEATAILRLRFRDIRVVLARDPEGGPHKLLLQFTPEFTKTYLGTKDS